MAQQAQQPNDKGNSANPVTSNTLTFRVVSGLCYISSNPEGGKLGPQYLTALANIPGLEKKIRQRLTLKSATVRFVDERYQEIKRDEGVNEVFVRKSPQPGGAFKYILVDEKGDKISPPKRAPTRTSTPPPETSTDFDFDDVLGGKVNTKLPALTAADLGEVAPVALKPKNGTAPPNEDAAKKGAEKGKPATGKKTEAPADNDPLAIDFGDEVIQTPVAKADVRKKKGAEEPVLPKVPPNKLEPTDEIELDDDEPLATVGKVASEATLPPVPAEAPSAKDQKNPVAEAELKPKATVKESDQSEPRDEKSDDDWNREEYEREQREKEEYEKNKPKWANQGLAKEVVVELSEDLEKKLWALIEKEAKGFLAASKNPKPMENFPAVVMATVCGGDKAFLEALLSRKTFHPEILKDKKPKDRDLKLSKKILDMMNPAKKEFYKQSHAKMRDIIGNIEGDKMLVRFKDQAFLRYKKR
jgi:hypothetical protein